MDPAGEPPMNTANGMRQSAGHAARSKAAGSTFTRLRAKLRTWRRNRQRDRKKLKKLKGSDIVLLRYPKSGVTWLRVMITNVYRSSIGSAGPEIVGRSAFHAAHKEIPNVFVCMDNFGLPQPELERRLKRKKIILLLRDPRDVVISHYFHISKRAANIAWIASNGPDAVAGEGVYQFAINPEFGMPRIINFMNYWFAAARRHPSAMIVKYEDLRRDTVGAFSPVMRLLLPGSTDKQIEEAVAAAQFDRMKSMEAAGSFGLDILAPGIKDDSNSFKVRRGKVGGYADYLTTEQKQHLDQMVAQTLDPAMGYS